MLLVGLSEVDSFCATRREAEAPIRALLAIVARADWRSTEDVKHQFGEIVRVESPRNIHLELAEHGVRIDMDVDFRQSLVRLRLVPIRKRRM
ncbi:MAG TPA: hypothetical protein VG983_09140 [Caulobacterales bacterium]|jgi:mRNA-degrading endonuclease HigB of HigAB toxin-antitoxin module|nr:hypothetical protein [Caulobacterales bacterium]